MVDLPAPPFFEGRLSRPQPTFRHVRLRSHHALHLGALPDLLLSGMGQRLRWGDGFGVFSDTAFPGRRPSAPAWIFSDHPPTSRGSVPYELNLCTASISHLLSGRRMDGLNPYFSSESLKTGYDSSQTFDYHHLFLCSIT